MNEPTYWECQKLAETTGAPAPCGEIMARAEYRAAVTTVALEGWCRFGKSIEDITADIQEVITEEVEGLDLCNK